MSNCCDDGDVNAVNIGCPTAMIDGNGIVGNGCDRKYNVVIKASG
jgi:hypothetical protein